jgi:hypothetical protein
MKKTVKRGRGHKIGPPKAWVIEHRRRIRLHRQRVIADMNHILKAGFDLHNTPIKDMLDAGVEISNPLYVTEHALKIVDCKM